MKPQIQTIRDIELPLPAQDDNALLTYIAIFIVVSVMLGVLYYRRARHARYKALRSLKHLARSLHKGSANPCRCAFEIAALLQHGLNLTRVSAKTGCPASLCEHRQRWQSFVDRLDAARYSTAPISDSTLVQLIAEAQFWIKRWP